METCTILFILTHPARFSSEIRPRADVLFRSQIHLWLLAFQDPLRLGIQFLKGRDYPIDGVGYISQCKMF